MNPACSSKQEETLFDIVIYLPFLLDFQTVISGVLEYDNNERVWRCTECGKTNTDKARIRRHAEIHFQGFVHSCPQCGVQKKTSTALRYHIHAYHTKKQ